MRASKLNSKLAMLLLGDVGTHKSELALESTKLVREDGKPMRVLYIDCENGSIVDRLARFEREGVNLDNLEIRYCQSFDEVMELIKHVTDHDDWYEENEDGTETNEIRLDADGKPFFPDFVVVDGMKMLFQSRQQTYLARSTKRAQLRTIEKEMSGLKKEVTINGAKLEPTDYQQLNFDGANLTMALVGCGCHFIITCFAKQQMMDDPNGGINEFGGKKQIPTGIEIPDAFKGIREYCKTTMVLTKELDNDGNVNIKGTIQDKDRTEVFPQGSVIENPTLLAWQKVINKATIVIPNKMAEASNKEANKMVEKENPGASVKLDRADEHEQASGESEVVSLKKKIEELMGTGEARKESIAKLKANKLGNYAKVTDVNVLKEYIAILG